MAIGAGLEMLQRVLLVVMAEGLLQMKGGTMEVEGVCVWMEMAKELPSVEVMELTLDWGLNE